VRQRDKRVVIRSTGANTRRPDRDALPAYFAPPAGPLAFSSSNQSVMSLTCVTTREGGGADDVWDSKSTKSTTNPNTRRPLKDGYYDHSQNCVEYILLKFGPTAPTKKQTAPKEDLDWRVYMPMGEHSWMA